MNVRKTIIRTAVACLCLAGCQTPPPKPAPKIRSLEPTPPPKPAPAPVAVKPKPKPPTLPKKRTDAQMQLLQDFAVKESPKTWETIQAMRGEIKKSTENIKRLRADLLEFNRNPDMDEDYNSLVDGMRELRRAYDAIFDKLEDAYIAAKKYEASPSRKDYQDTMKRALEDGIQSATMATERYKAMTRQK